MRNLESQKVKALLAFLVLNRERAVDRDHLAEILWAERSVESARKNLRQALYSIRTAVAGSGNGATDFIVSEQRALRLNPELNCLVDSESFQNSYEQALTEQGTDPHQLRTAARLYKGDFLAGFYLRDAPGFEEWMLTRQEELRDAALEIFRMLVAVYLARGEHRYGIRYARRLLSIDPLSEEAHRQLMQLYLMAGRRTQALAQYEHLHNLLQRELRVEPLTETSDLYHSILLEGADSSTETVENEPPAPLVPLVGRARAFEALQEEWDQVVEGSGRLTWVRGEVGIGKSRLIKSFVDGVTSKHHAIVLRGRSYDQAPLVSYQPFVEFLDSVVKDVFSDEEIPLSSLPPRTLELFRRLSPSVQEAIDADQQVKTAPGSRKASVPHIADALLQLFDRLTALEGDENRPLVLMLEDLQWADEATGLLLAAVVPHLASRPVWLLVTATDDQPAISDHPVLQDARQVSLTRLAADEIEEIARALVDLDSAPTLAEFLWQQSEGLPLAVAEVINCLWDDGVLEPRPDEQWGIDPERLAALPLPATLAELIHKRILRLPTSARRLLAVAAVAGHQFDVDILQPAADEHRRVVETCIELALERWLIRQFPRTWAPSGKERDIVLWARGARRGYFEFAHNALRRSVIDNINPLRRAVMHRDVAGCLEEFYKERPDHVVEALAYHWLAAGEPQRAVPWLKKAVKRAEAAGAKGVAENYRKRLDAAQLQEEKVTSVAAKKNKRRSGPSHIERQPS